jgi:hypothetical protein
LTGERRSVNPFATDYQLRDGFAEIVLKSEMTGSSAAKRAEATGLNSTVIARLAGQIAMAGGFALSEVAISMQFRSRSSSRFDLLPAATGSAASRSRGECRCGVDRGRQYRHRKNDSRHRRRRVQAAFQYRAKPVLTGELRFTNQRERCAAG